MKGEINVIRKEIQELKENASSNSKQIQSLYDISSKFRGKSSETTQNMSHTNGNIKSSLNCEHKDDFPDKCEQFDQEDFSRLNYKFHKKWTHEEVN